MRINHAKIILEQINKFIETSDLKEAIKTLSDKSNKLIVLNNSFLFRKTKTKKNDKYIAFIPDKIPIDENNCFIVIGPSLIKNFSIMTINDKKISKKISLKDSIIQELKSLGEIVFILMGKIDKSKKVSEEIDHSIIKKVSYHPIEKNTLKIADDEIILKELDNDSENWENIEELLKNDPRFNMSHIDELKNKIGKIFDKLKKEVCLNLIIPINFERNEDYFLELITKAIEEQYKIYQDNVKKLTSASNDRQYCLNEILRISYNFVEDASTLIRLIVSVCDLKPIILWETYCLHYELDESIRLLPWAKQIKKPSLSDYIDTIKKARNKSFHRLIPFSKSFEVPLPDNSIKKPTLVIFSEFRSKFNSNRLDYIDKELIEVLLELTRTSEEIVEDDFWEKNSEVINKTINLLKGISNTIRGLREQ
jgi:hypothetical protein